MTDPRFMKHGWESTWPLTFRIHDGTGIYDDVSVEMKYSPSFYVRELKS